MGVVQFSQDESKEHKGSHRRGLEGNSGSGLVGDQWVRSGKKWCVFLKQPLGAVQGESEWCSGKGTVGVVLRGSMGVL